MKRIVYIIELDVPEHMGDNPYFMNELFKDTLVTWCTYFPKEGDSPIRINITTEGAEEI